MSTLAQVLKAEISRLARKEVRQETTALRKAATQHRRDIAELKRQLKEQQRRIDYLEKQETRRVKKPKLPDEQVEKIRFSPKWLRSHREKLGLSAADYAQAGGRFSSNNLPLGTRANRAPEEPVARSCGCPKAGCKRSSAATGAAVIC